VAHIADMLKFADADNANERAQAILELETKIAQGHWPREKRRNRDLTLNQIKRDELSTAYPDFNWDAYFAQTGYKVPQLNVSQPEPIKAMIELINQEDLAVWKDYLTYHAISGNANLLSEDIFNTNFAFFGKELNGQQEPRPRWKRAIDEMSSTNSLGFAIGKIYVARYFPESSKQQMSELVENLRTALGERIDNLEWMGAETKVNARAKLAAFVPKIGYPDVWQSYEGLTISNNDLIGNVKNMREFFQAESVAKELQKTDRNRWGMTPQRVNAYYNSSFNEIVFPAAILQPPFFNLDADDAVNYGGIGAVIGHEMGHGFDDQGAKFDGEGNMRDWWTEADLNAFESKGNALIAQYNGYQVFDDLHVNGSLTLGENIGDLSGVTIAYKAYKMSLDGKEAPVIDGLTGDQRFFMGFTQIWRVKMKEEAMRNRVATDPHSPGHFRALGALSNMPEFYSTYDVKEGDKMYIEPTSRVKIW